MKINIIAEHRRLYNLLAEERIFWKQGVKFVAGVDEAGRGPLAGPVVAAAVILAPLPAAGRGEGYPWVIPGLKESKQVAETMRSFLYDRIMDSAVAVGIGTGSVAEIEKLNIFMATMLSMRRALADLKVAPGAVLVDGCPIREISIRQKAIVRGDELSLSIAAASIIAKVTRDRYMLDLHDRYPVYGFKRHKGYATGEHRRALADYGPCSEHRLSFNLMGRDQPARLPQAGRPAGTEGADLK